MSTNLHMKDYRIVGQVKNLQDARAAIETLDRGLWGTEHAVLRDDVGSLRHDLVTSKSLNKDLSQRVEDVISRFTKLETDTINKELLDNKDLPMGKPQSDNNEDDNPSPKKSDDTTTPTWAKELREDLFKLSATDKNGKPTKAASLDEQQDQGRRITALENSTYVNIDMRATVKLFGKVFFVVWAILFLLMVFTVDLTFSAAAIWSFVIGLGVGLAVATISPRKN